MPVLCLVGNNGRTEKPKKETSEVEVETLVVGSIIGTASLSGIVSEREGDTDNTEEQESAVGGEEDDDAGEGPSAAGHPAAPTPSTKCQSAGRVLRRSSAATEGNDSCSQQLD
ncbi:unnamed protein product [Boreogadus saida]